MLATAVSLLQEGGRKEHGWASRKVKLSKKRRVN